MRWIGLALIAVVGSLMAVKAGSSFRALIGIAGCALFASGFLALTKPRKLPLWADTAVLASSAPLLLGLMLLDDRPMLPGILFFILIPATARMPLAHRVSAPLSAVASLACLYVVRRLYASIDPIVPICQFACIVCLAAIMEVARRRNESMEENARLLEGLISAQRRIADAESQRHATDAVAAFRKAIGGLLAKAALQVEGAKELWPVDQSRAAQLSYKAEETIRMAMDQLRQPSTAGVNPGATLPARILLAQANEDMAECLAILAETDPDLAIAATAAGADELLRRCGSESFDLVLIDEDLPPGGGLSVLGRVAREHPGLRCLVVSALPGRDLDAKAREGGAIGVLDCGAAPGEVLASIRRVALGPRRSEGQSVAAAVKGKPEFTARELQILALIAKGFSNKEISERLFLAEGTVKNRVSAILQKIDARDRGNAALKARELGLI